MKVRDSPPSSCSWISTPLPLFCHYSRPILIVLLVLHAGAARLSPCRCTSDHALLPGVTIFLPVAHSPALTLLGHSWRSPSPGVCGALGAHSRRGHSLRSPASAIIAPLTPAAHSPVLNSYAHFKLSALLVALALSPPTHCRRTFPLSSTALRFGQYFHCRQYLCLSSDLLHAKVVNLANSGRSCDFLDCLQCMSSMN